MKKIFLIILASAIALGLSIASRNIFAVPTWTEPTATPPNNNTATPVDTSASSQTKLGDLGIGGNFAVTGNSALMGSVGVGTDTPNQKLSVTGIIQSSSGGIQFPDNTIQTSAAINKINVKVFTGSGTYTPSPGLVYAVIEVVGGGGGGAAGYLEWGSCANPGDFPGCGGASGGYARKTLTAAQIGSSQPVVVGGGGGGGNSNNFCDCSGGSGGTSSFGPLVSPFLSATGGGGGGGSVDWSWAGGNGSGGDVNISGQYGFPSFWGNPGYYNPPLPGGMGGSSHFGAGGRDIAGNDGSSGKAYGSGGGGGSLYEDWSSGSYTAYNGGNGAPGVVIVTEYISKQ